jgi:hypothetical protein
MRNALSIICLIMLTSALACAAEPPLAKPAAGAAAAGEAPAAADPAVENLLQALKVRGQDLQNFTADVSLTWRDLLLGADDKTDIGHIWFQRKPDGDARIRVSFDTRKVGNKTTNHRIEYKLEGGYFIDQNFDSKLQVTRRVLKPGEKFDPLKLGQGPFPLPIGQEPADVLRQFDVKKVAPAKDDPADAGHLTLTPRPGTSFARKFETIEVFVDSKSHFPVRMEAVEKGGATARVTELSNIKINAGITDANFKLPEPGRDWGVRDEELGE